MSEKTTLEDQLDERKSQNLVNADDDKNSQEADAENSQYGGNPTLDAADSLDEGIPKDEATAEDDEGNPEDDEDSQSDGLVQDEDDENLQGAVAAEDGEATRDKDSLNDSDGIGQDADDGIVQDVVATKVEEATQDKDSLNDEEDGGEAKSEIEENLKDRVNTTTEAKENPESDPIDRDALNQEYRDVSSEKGFLTLKNNLLHRKVVEYFKKRNVEQALKEVESIGGVDLEAKYHEKLLLYKQLKESQEAEEKMIAEGIQQVEVIRNKRRTESDGLFTGFQGLERSTGIGLIFSKTGKELSEKVVDRFLRRQNQASKTVSELQLRYLRMKAAVAEEELVLDQLEHLGEGLHIRDYEQLKIDNQILVEKIEERDEELASHRTRCSGDNQILAHIREKMSFLNDACSRSERQLKESKVQMNDTRRALNAAQARRDKARADLRELKKKSGLLHRKDLLHDYEAAISKCELLTKKCDELKTDLKVNSERRRTLEDTLAAKSPIADNSDASLKKPRIHHRRPSNPKSLTSADMRCHVINEETSTEK